MKRETTRTSVFTRRALLLMGGQVALLGGLAAKLYQEQVVDGARYATLAEDNRISARMIAPPRGRVLDRHGIVIAGSRINWRALLVSEQTNNVQATLEAFSRIVPLSETTEGETSGSDEVLVLEAGAEDQPLALAGSTGDSGAGVGELSLWIGAPYFAQQGQPGGVVYRVDLDGRSAE